MDSQQIMIIKPQKHNILLNLPFLLLGFIGIYYNYRKAEWIWFGLFIFVFSILLALTIRDLSYIIRGKNFYDTLILKLTPQGFYEGDNLYRWSDIESFGVKKEYITLFSFLRDCRVVYWNYNPNYEKKRSGFFQAGDDSLSVKYEMKADKLVEVLNDWKTRYSSESH
jgi:hypothetical protein